jgi:MFS family permease
MVVSVFPAFMWLRASPTPTVLAVISALFSVIIVIQGVPSLTLLPELFPRRVRASGMSLVYSVGVAVFGGFAPFICAWLVEATGSQIAPAWYLFAATVVSLIGLRQLIDRTGQDIDSEPQPKVFSGEVERSSIQPQPR